MKMQRVRFILLLLIMTMVLIPGCNSGSLPIDHETTDPTTTQTTKKTPESTVTDPLDGLTGANLYNAIMLPKFEDRYMFKMVAENMAGVQEITKYYSNGDFKEFYTQNNETSITVFDDKDKIIYTYSEESPVCHFIQYEPREDGTYEMDPKLLLEVDTLTVSEIIDFNGRVTYYYEREFSGSDSYVSKYWIDVKTKVEMKVEVYLNGDLISQSIVTELQDDYVVPANFFMPPDDKELIDLTDVVSGTH
ncbi:hypothetical protein QTL97_11105 [Sporosarcina thermotolerans]|uniref:DUF4412 domain-containing protein n=1 Tax=Sporosarcina thermotolerans TaxID=633404 RepID=A0AAW9A922_9BACL|nr:hypothetical protein [Sporosarcina thermotolerans]MDW0117485.1 hypothetical protein [Sporosarcina thermotolerans]WHT49657.1 hypothetical protein QNH10_09250 [Sporosarcina thermotolerans]